jgi:hypothetical protein
MPRTLNDVRAATDRVAAAETQLDELAAMVDLERLVCQLTRHLMSSAFQVFTPTEISRALGQSRQAVSQKRKRAGVPAGPSTEVPSTEGPLNV